METEGLVLSIGGNVCSSRGKCVDNNTTFFSAYTCLSNSFVCQSDYDDLVSNYNDLAEKHRNLISCIENADSIDDIKWCL